MIVAVVAIVAALLQPTQGSTERSIIVDKSPEVVYVELMSFENFNKWSPWFTIDPNTEYEYTGPETGVGAKMAWTSDHPDVGTGSQEIIEVEKNRKIVTKMDFGFDGDYYADFILEPQGNGTKITWVYRYENLNPFSALMSSIFDAETMVGEDYEIGLKNFKNYIETKTVLDPIQIEAEEIEGDSLARDSVVVDEDM